MKLKALLPKTTEYAAEFHKLKQTGVPTMKKVTLVLVGLTAGRSLC